MVLIERLPRIFVRRMVFYLTCDKLVIWPAIQTLVFSTLHVPAFIIGEKSQNVGC